MSRLPRHVVPGQPQHVIQRGNNRSATFAAADDYRVFLRWLAAACELHGCAVHAYVLMTNHVHLLITPHTERAIASAMQSVGRRYVRYFNDRYRRSGTLWEGRYRSTLIDSARYLLACYRYVELNPVRSGQVVRPEDYRWSSYRANALGKYDPLVVPHELYFALGKNVKARCQAYRALVAASVQPAELVHIRESTNRGWPLGDDRFRDAVTAQLQRRASPSPKGGDRRSEVYRQGINRL